MYIVASTTHKKGQARQKGNVELALKEIKTGTKASRTFSSSDSVEEVDVPVEPHTILYVDGEGVHAMHEETFEQLAPLDGDLFGPLLPLMTDGVRVGLRMHDGVPVGVVPPDIVTAEVDTVPPTSTGSSVDKAAKRVRLVGGHELSVPDYIAPGDKIVVRTSDLAYSRRANEDKKRST
ncbi:unnamed protein product [Pedinophyceae sp. YPF-701]|nr:unnamed protein product [Pedinophyceae sp. YPF-701]